MSPRLQTFKQAQRFSGQKRKIRKLVYRMTVDPATIADQAVTIDTIEEEETLVRIVGNINLAPLLADPGYLVMAIKVFPSATNLKPLTAGAAVTDEGRDAGVYLWHQVWQSSHSATTDGSYNIPIDVKGMRKLKEGDTIALEYISDTDNGINVSMMVSLFYKKA